MTEEDRIETVANLLAISTLSQRLITFLDTDNDADLFIRRIVEWITERRCRPAKQLMNKPFGGPTPSFQHNKRCAKLFTRL
jgi:hypothetical protein